MKTPSRVAAAAVLWLAGTAFAADARAGASAYDISALLAEPHPFANTPPALPEVGTPLYETQIRAPARFPSPAAGGSSGVMRPAAERSLFDRRGLAQAPPPEPERAGDPAFLVMGAGWYDFNDSEGAAEFRVEWRGRQWIWGIRPLAGVMATSDTAVYGYGGLALDLFFGRRIVLTPSFAAGLYHEGSGKDLGSIVEFRSALELGWRFDDRSRISAMVYHISNASIDDNNPGTEVFSIAYSMPF